MTRHRRTALLFAALAVPLAAAPAEPPAAAPAATGADSVGTAWRAYDLPETLLRLPGALAYMDRRDVDAVRGLAADIASRHHRPVARVYSGTASPPMSISHAELKELGCEDSMLNIAYDLQHRNAAGDIDKRQILYLPFVDCILSGSAMTVHGDYDRVTSITVESILSHEGAVPGLNAPNGLRPLADWSRPWLEIVNVPEARLLGAEQARGGKIEYYVYPGTTPEKEPASVSLLTTGADFDIAFARSGTLFYDPTGGAFTPTEGVAGLGVYRFSPVYLRAINDSSTAGMLVGKFDAGCQQSWSATRPQCHLRVLPYQPIVYGFVGTDGKQYNGWYFGAEPWAPPFLPPAESRWPALDHTINCALPFAQAANYRVGYCGKVFGLFGTNPAQSAFEKATDRIFVSADGKAGSLRIISGHAQGTMELMILTAPEWTTGANGYQPVGSTKIEWLTIRDGAVVARRGYSGPVKDLKPDGIGQCDDGTGAGFQPCENMGGQKVESFT